MPHQRLDRPGPQSQDRARRVVVATVVEQDCFVNQGQCRRKHVVHHLPIAADDLLRINRVPAQLHALRHSVHIDRWILRRHEVQDDSIPIRPSFAQKTKPSTTVRHNRFGDERDPLRQESPTHFLGGDGGVPLRCAARDIFTAAPRDGLRNLSSALTTVNRRNSPRMASTSVDLPEPFGPATRISVGRDAPLRAAGTGLLLRVAARGQRLSAGTILDKSSIPERNDRHARGDRRLGGASPGAPRNARHIVNRQMKRTLLHG